MKSTLLLVFFSTLMYSQSNEDIANVYLRRAEIKYKEQKNSEAMKNYSKAMKYIDLEKNPDVSIPKFGMILFAKAKYYSKAKEYSKDYFRLVSDKTTDEYLEMLELYVEIVDKLEDQEDSEGTQVKQTSPENDNSNHYNFDNIIKNRKN